MSEPSDTPRFTPALGFKALTPLYDAAIALLTRENAWRHALCEQVAPGPEDHIVDVGCGTGSLVMMLKRACPAAMITGVDPDPEVLVLARKKAAAADLDIRFVQGFLTAELPLGPQAPTKVVSSLVFHQVPLDGKRRLAATIRALLPAGGEFHLADYGLQRTPLMRALFRATVQALDGTADTQPNADGALPAIFRDAGFAVVEETRLLPTFTGTISLFRMR